MQFDVKGKAEDAKDKIAPILAAVDGVQAGNPSLIIQEFGQASADHSIGQRFDSDMRRAEFTSLPLTLAILLVAFGALVAAGLPVLLAFSAVLAATGLNSLVSHVVPTDEQTLSAIILMIGMAVGIDYSLFYLRREREERQRGRRRTRRCCARRAPRGRRCSISGATVLIAMAGMFVSGNSLFTTIGARDDDRRPLRDDRLADGAAGAAAPARRQGRLRPDPALPRRVRATTARGAASSAASCAARCRALVVSGGALVRCSRCRPSACTRSSRTSPTCRTT